MDSLPATEARAVEAELNYLAPLEAKPEVYNHTPPPGVPERNFEDVAVRMRIEDFRPWRDEASLDIHGFAAVEHASAEHAFADEAAIAGAYYAETEQLLKHRLGADRIFIFDHTIRRRLPREEDRPGQRQPVARVHVDQTPAAGIARVRRHMGEDANTLLRGRVQIINVWRPIRGPVLDRPLALCDWRSVDEADLVATDLVYPEHRGEVYSITPNPRHRWHYLSAMRPDEVLLIKCFDTAIDGRARLTPHTAFVDPTTPADAPPRQSIELRALVFSRRE